MQQDNFSSMFSSFATSLEEKKKGQQKALFVLPTSNRHMLLARSHRSHSSHWSHLSHRSETGGCSYTESVKFTDSGYIMCSRGQRSDRRLQKRLAIHSPVNILIVCQEGMRLLLMERTVSHSCQP